MEMIKPTNNWIKLFQDYHKIYRKALEKEKLVKRLKKNSKEHFFLSQVKKFKKLYIKY